MKHSHVRTPARQTNNFEAVRIGAASAVLFSHHFALTGQREPSFLGLHSWGGLAVMVFFVISGYLVTASWYDDPSFLRFSLRRILRIWPALTVVVVVTACGLGAWVTTMPLAEYWKNRATWDYLLMLKMQMHHVLPGVFESNPYARGVNGSLWTIPLEVRCYVILALAGLLRLMRFQKIWLLLIGAYMVWFWATNSADVTGGLHFKHELAAFFLAGSALFILQPHWERKPLLWLVALSAIAALLWLENWRYTALWVLLPFLVVYAGTRSTPVIRRFDRWGDPSYGIYLIAFPVQQTVIHFLWPRFGFVATMALAIVITVTLAYASWHFVEKKALKLKPHRGFRIDIKITHRVRLSLLMIGLCAVYAIWLIGCWPGVLGQDSLAIMLEVESHQDFISGKPVFWYLYNLILYGPWHLVQVPIITQIIICCLVLSRILNWMWIHGMKKSFWYCLICVALAPSILYYVCSLYSDGIYAIATAGMLFEIWRIYRQRRLDYSGCLMLLVTVPFCLFSRPNGLINILAFIPLIVIFARSDRWRLAAVLLPWCLVAVFAQIQFKSRPIGTVFPLALYESVGFLENRPMGLWEHNEPRVSQKTIDALVSTGKSIDNIQKFYDHYYWDPLTYFPQGPALLALPERSKKTIIREFFKYNVWHNFPAFAASRINIFLYSCFAEGGIPGLKNAEYILPQSKSNSMIRFRNGAAHHMINDWFDFTISHRVIFWTPWVGLWLILFGLVRTWRRCDRPGMVITTTLILQLVAVFGFSIAGEYRYLLAFFTAPLVLLPVLYADNTVVTHD